MQIKSFVKKNKKAIIIAGGLLAVGIVFLLIKKGNKNGGVPVVGGSTKSGISWPIKKKAGSLTTPQEQEVIKNIQRYLNTKITYVEVPLDVDGFFGEKTETAANKILGVKTISNSLYNEIINS